MTVIRLECILISLGALMLHGVYAADPAAPSQNAGQDTGNHAAAQSGEKSGGDHQATSKQPEANNHDSGHAIDKTGKNAPTDASSAHNEGKLQDKPTNADGKHQSDKATPGSTATATEAADLQPSHPDNQEPLKPLHPDHPLPGKGMAKTVLKKSQAKGTKQSSTTEANSVKTPSAPMASAEAASTTKKATPPSSPMAAAEAVAVQKKVDDLHVAKAKALEKVDAKPETDKSRPALVGSQQRGSSLNGTSAALPRGKTPPLAVIDGSKISKGAKGAAGVSGTSMR